MKIKVKTIEGSDPEELHANLTKFIGDPNVEVVSVSYPDDTETAVVVYRETYFKHF